MAMSTISSIRDKLGKVEEDKLFDLGKVLFTEDRMMQIAKKESVKTQSITQSNAEFTSFVTLY